MGRVEGQVQDPTLCTGGKPSPAPWPHGSNKQAEPREVHGPNGSLRLLGTLSLCFFVVSVLELRIA